MSKGKLYWWEEKYLRFFEIANCFEENLEGNSSVEISEAVRKIGANSQHFHCMFCPGGLDDRRLFFKTKVAKRINRDILGEYLPEAHRRGIKVIVYFNVHWFTREFGKEHPDWLQIKEDGNPVDDVYTTGVSFCVNGPWRDWVFQIVGDLGKYEIDGIFFDGPIFFAESCYCRSCKALFKKEYGFPIPSKKDREGVHWPDLVKFQSDSIARFLKDSRRNLRKVNQSALLYMNCSSYGAFWPTGRDNRKIIKYTDILGAEGGFLHGNLSDSFQNPIFKPSVTAKLLETQSGGKPVVVFIAPGHKPWSFYLLPGPEISLLYAQTIANGANVWAAVLPGDLKEPQMNVIREYNDFIEKHNYVYTGTKPAAKVALLWSARTANFYRGSTVPLTDFTQEMKSKAISDYYLEFLGLYDALARGHFPFDVIDEEELRVQKSKLRSKYDVIVMPNVACLGKEHVEHLAKFVKAGGNIIATFETSLYDEEGKRRPDFQLNKVFGIHCSNRIFGPMEWDYISGQGEKFPQIFKGITQKFLPAPRYGMEVELNTAEKLSSFYEKLKGRYDGIPRISPRPLLTINNFGKGKALYLAGTFGQVLNEFGLEEYYRIVHNSVNYLSQPLIKLENVPSSIQVTLRKKEGGLFIHLINFTSEMKRPMERIIPIQDIKIYLRHINNPRKIKALWANKRLKFQKKDDGITFTLPEIKEYEVIEVE